MIIAPKCNIQVVYREMMERTGEAEMGVREIETKTKSSVEVNHL